MNPLLDLYAPGTVCELTDAGLHFAPGEAGARFVVSGVTKDGQVACTKEGRQVPYTLPPRALRPVSTEAAPRRSEGTGAPVPA